MPDERQAAGHEPGDDGRRRHFRRRQRPGRSGREGGNAAESSARPPAPPARRRGADRRMSEGNGVSSPRLGRRRRRTRTRGNSPLAARPEAPSQEVADLTDYRPPTSVFIYTHISRPGSGWDSYEFRAEHFTKGGRTLDDFQIDLSKLYLDGVLSSTAQIESDSEE